MGGIRTSAGRKGQSSLECPGQAGPFRCLVLSPWRHFSQLTNRFPGTTVSERQTQHRSSSPGRAAAREHSVMDLSFRQVSVFHGMNTPRPLGSHQG